MPEKNKPSDSFEQKESEENVFTRKTIPTIAPPKDISLKKYRPEEEEKNEQHQTPVSEKKIEDHNSNPGRITTTDKQIRDKTQARLKNESDNDAAIIASLDQKLAASREELKNKKNIFNTDFAPEKHHSSNRNGTSKSVASNMIKGLEDKVSTLSAETNDAKHKLRLRPPPPPSSGSK